MTLFRRLAALAQGNSSSAILANAKSRYDSGMESIFKREKSENNPRNFLRHSDTAETSLLRSLPKSKHQVNLLRLHLAQFWLFSKAIAIYLHDVNQKNELLHLTCLLIFIYLQALPQLNQNDIHECMMVMEKELFSDVEPSEIIRASQAKIQLPGLVTEDTEELAHQRANPKHISIPAYPDNAKRNLEKETIVFSKDSIANAERQEKSTINTAIDTLDTLNSIHNSPKNNPSIIEIVSRIDYLSTKRNNLILSENPWQDDNKFVANRKTEPKIPPSKNIDFSKYLEKSDLIQNHDIVNTKSTLREKNGYQPVHLEKIPHRVNAPAERMAKDFANTINFIFQDQKITDSKSALSTSQKASVIRQNHPVGEVDHFKKSNRDIRAKLHEQKSILSPNLEESLSLPSSTVAFKNPSSNYLVSLNNLRKDREKSRLLAALGNIEEQPQLLIKKHPNVLSKTEKPLSHNRQNPLSSPPIAIHKFKKLRLPLTLLDSVSEHWQPPKGYEKSLPTHTAQPSPEHFFGAAHVSDRFSNQRIGKISPPELLKEDNRSLDWSTSRQGWQNPVDSNHFSSQRIENISPPELLTEGNCSFDKSTSRQGWQNSVDKGDKVCFQETGSRYPWQNVEKREGAVTAENFEPKEKLTRQKAHTNKFILNKLNDLSLFPIKDKITPFQKANRQANRRLNDLAFDSKSPDPTQPILKNHSLHPYKSATKGVDEGIPCGLLEQIDSNSPDANQPIIKNLFSCSYENLTNVTDEERPFTLAKERVNHSAIILPSESLDLEKTPTNKLPIGKKKATVRIKLIWLTPNSVNDKTKDKPTTLRQRSSSTIEKLSLSEYLNQF